MITKLIIIIAIIFLLSNIYAITIASAPRTDEEQTREDQEQLEFIAKWRKEREKYNKQKSERIIL